MSDKRTALVVEKALVLMGQSPSSSTCSENGDGLPFIQGNAEFGRRNPSPQLKCSSPTRVAEAGDLLLSVRAPVGALNQATRSTVIGRGLSAIRFDPAQQGFAWHSVKYSAPTLNRVAQGSTFVAVSREDVERMVIPWHDDSNPRIAAVLDTSDEAITKTEAVIAKLRQVRTGLLHDLLTCGLDENGQLRDPVAHPEQFKNSPLGLIPKEWDTGPLRKYSRPDRPYLKTGPFGSNLKQEHWVFEGVPVVTIGSLGEGSFIHSELLHVSPETALALQSYVLKTGDIVFSRVADVGRSIVVTDAECGWIMSSNMMWIALDECKVVPNYVQTQIAHSPVIRSQIRAFVNAGGRDVANSNVMNALSFFWPPKPEQEAAMEILTGLNRQISAEEFALAKHDKLKSGLLDDLLTGRVRVPEGMAVRVENRT